MLDGIVCCVAMHCNTTGWNKKDACSIGSSFILRVLLCYFLHVLTVFKIVFVFVNYPSLACTFGRSLESAGTMVEVASHS